MAVIMTDGTQYMFGKLQERIDDVVCDIASCNVTLSSSFESLACRVNILEDSMSETLATLKELQDYIRSATSAKTENPKRKDDLEIFPQIEWDEDFLKSSDNMFLIDL